MADIRVIKERLYSPVDIPSFQYRISFEGKKILDNIEFHAISQFLKVESHRGETHFTKLMAKAATELARRLGHNLVFDKNFASSGDVDNAIHASISDPFIRRGNY